MGTTLHALVEVLEPAVPEYDLAEQWTDVSRWDFGKSYSLMMGLHDAGIAQEWPPDPSVEAEELREECIADTGHMWCERELLPDLELDGWELEAYVSLRSSLVPFTRPVRVLFWTL